MSDLSALRGIKTKQPETLMIDSTFASHNNTAWYAVRTATTQEGMA